MVGGAPTVHVRAQVQQEFHCIDIAIYYGHREEGYRAIE